MALKRVVRPVSLGKMGTYCTGGVTFYRASLSQMSPLWERGPVQFLHDNLLNNGPACCSCLKKCCPQLQNFTFSTTERWLLSAQCGCINYTATERGPVFRRYCLCAEHREFLEAGAWLLRCEFSTQQSEHTVAGVCTGGTRGFGDSPVSVWHATRSI